MPSLNLTWRWRSVTLKGRWLPSVGKFHRIRIREQVLFAHTSLHLAPATAHRVLAAPRNKLEGDWLNCITMTSFAKDSHTNIIIPVPRRSIINKFNGNWMSEIFTNAVTSIVLGIEDFEDGTDERMLSAARNYYAGLLLLAKECLVSAAPEADAMDIIGAKFKPIPNGEGGVEHVVMGYATIDLAQLQQRFKDFGLPWPDVNINKLQQFRNNLEHYHLKEPVSALGEAIASSFPMLVDFFKILGEDPQTHLVGVWDTIIAERATFEKVRTECLISWEGVDWPAPVKHLDKMLCPECKSSLVGQADAKNEDHTTIDGKCFQCGEEIDREKLKEMVAQASYEIDAYLMAKDGLNSAIASCPECGVKAYVETGEFSVCLSCGESVAGECSRCSTSIDVHEYSPDHPELCSYCAHMWEKVMRE